MRNDVPDAIEVRPTDPVIPEPAPVTPLLLVLAGDDDALCTDELCLPAEGPRPLEDLT